MNGISILEMKNITKRFPGTVALNGVDFSVQEGEVHCLVGGNGAGKSTLMKILAGVHRADEGQIFISGEQVRIDNPQGGMALGIAVIYQELSLIPGLNIAENIFLGNYPVNKAGLVDWRKMKEDAQEVIDLLNVKIDPEADVANLSIGHQQMVEIAKALVRNANILVMDEPSATLSADEFDALVAVINNLKKQGITIIYISHRLSELFTVGDRVTVLKNGKYVTTENLRDLNEDKIAELMVGKPLQEYQEKKSAEESQDLKEILVEVNEIRNKNLNGVSLHLKRQEVLGLYGIVGSGRTELIRAIFGVDAIQSGEVLVEGVKVKINSPAQAIEAGFGLLPEERQVQGVIVDFPVWENIVLSSFTKFAKYGLLSFKNIFSTADSTIDKLNIKTPSHKSVIKTLSGGNQQKVSLGKWLVSNSEILLLDEPTQGIDIGAKQEIYLLIGKLAKEAGKSIIFVSSELDELITVCDRIVVMNSGNVIGEFDRDSFDKSEIQKCAILGENITGM